MDQKGYMEPSELLFGNIPMRVAKTVIIGENVLGVVLSSGLISIQENSLVHTRRYVHERRETRSFSQG